MVKQRLTRAHIMAYYRLNADTRRFVCWLGSCSSKEAGRWTISISVLCQQKATRRRNKVFSVWREALAVKWAGDKFHFYLYSTEFEIHTDHKPLIQVYGGQAKPPNARLERCLLSLQQYSFKIKYIRGWKNLADWFSRLSHKRE